MKTYLNIRKIVDTWLRKYDIKNTNVLTVLIRGTDKDTEVLPSTLEEYFNLVDKYIIKYKDARILIQTDQFQIRSKFIKRYKKKVFYIDEIPITKGKIVMHELKLKDDKLNFGIKICAMIFTLSHTNYLITHTGNGGFFLSMLFFL